MKRKRTLAAAVAAVVLAGGGSAIAAGGEDAAPTDRTADVIRAAEPAPGSRGGELTVAPVPAS